MTTPRADWEQRVAALRAAIDRYEPGDFRARIKEPADELPAGHAAAHFEVASAYGTTGVPDAAAPLYRKALEAGLTATAVAVR